jgi:hypothetical protein
MSNMEGMLEISVQFNFGTKVRLCFFFHWLREERERSSDSNRKERKISLTLN